MNSEHIKQGTDEWFKARKGRITASNLDCLLVKGKDKSTLGTSAITLCEEKLAERLCDTITSFDNPYMQWGTDHEDEARQLFMEVTGKEVIETGFHVPDDEDLFTGGSPDGLIPKDNAIIEIKAPATSKVHLKTLMTKEVNDKKYMLQMQWNMYCTGTSLCYFVSYDPRFTASNHKMVIIEVKRDEEMIDTIKERMRIAEEYIATLKAKIGK